MNDNKEGNIILIAIFFLFVAVALSSPYWMAEPTSPVVEQSPSSALTEEKQLAAEAEIQMRIGAQICDLERQLKTEQRMLRETLDRLQAHLAPLPAPAVEPPVLTPSPKLADTGPDLGMFPAAHPRPSADAVKPLSPVVEQSPSPTPVVQPPIAPPPVVEQSPPPVPAVVEPPVLTPPPSPQGAAPSSASPPAPRVEVVKKVRRVESIEQFRKEAKDLDLGE